MAENPSKQEVVRTPSLSGSLLSYADKRKWSNKVDYVMSCISMAIGLGNLWRFPYICYENGGGAFLIPYIVAILILARPLYFLDMCSGQCSGMGTVRMYHSIGPGWTGIGICQNICCFAVSSYYAYILALAGVFIVHSCSTNLPWADCDPAWGNNCIPARATAHSGNESQSNSTERLFSSSELFLNINVLKKKDDISDGIGAPDWKLSLSLLLIWTLTFFDILYGVKTSGKVAYVNVITPYVVVGTIFIKALFLPGSVDGIMYLVRPDWEKMMSLTVWREAVLQCFYSLGIGYGMIANYASFNEVHARVDLVSWLINIMDPVTCIFNSMTVFAMLGFIAHSLGKEVSEVMKGEGITMAFVSYPEAIANFDTVPQLFAFIFFLMMIILGIGNLAGFMQVVTNNMRELYGFLTEWQVAMIASVSCFLVGLVYTTPGGIAALNIADYFGNVDMLPLLSLLQIISIIYVYGLRDWCWNVAYMMCGKVHWYWRWTWSVITPVFLVILYLTNFFDDSKRYYAGKLLPTPVLASAWCLFFLIHMPLVYYAVKSMWFYRDLPFFKAFKVMFNTHTFGHGDEDTKAAMERYRGRKYDRWPYKEESMKKQFWRCLTHKV